MRIIAGKFRSRPVRSLPGADLRPTSDRLRETLFNVIAAARPIEDTVWLDLFAGTGAVGIEALSRGAKKVYFVEAARKSAELIGQNLRSLKIETGFQVFQQDAVAAIAKITEPVDICFLDPPYKLEDQYEKVLTALAKAQPVGKSSIVIAEHSKHFDPADGYGGLQRFRKLVQGDAVLSFYKSNS
ncbi:MAG TPA: 16S rRNA (guanine(966)-N(2))-methyltransferase RsmD [Terriglobales bacterium]|nr:16S rRNA (guanine(966)-N(2))-methyltransferase RsmD [Terriglobales bacterium]